MLSHETKANAMEGKELLIAHLLKDGILEADEALGYLLLSIGFSPEQTKEFVDRVALHYKTVKSTNRWSDSDDDIIVAMFGEGSSTKDIAKRLSKTVASVNQRIFILRRSGYTLPSRRPGLMGNSYAHKEKE